MMADKTVMELNRDMDVATNETRMLEVLRASLYPGARIDSVRMVLEYCKAQRLDPFSKPVHLVPISVKEGGEWKTRDVIMPGINLYRIRAERAHGGGTFLGTSEPEFGPTITLKLGGQDIMFPEWCRVTVKKLVVHGGQQHITEWPAKEFWLENYQTAGRDTAKPNSMWMKRPSGQLAKCAEAQALRKAYPDAVGAEPTFEERGIEDVVGALTDDRSPETPPPTEESPPKTRSDAALARVQMPKRASPPSESAEAPQEPAQGNAIAADPVPTHRPNAPDEGGGLVRFSSPELDAIHSNETLDLCDLEALNEIGGAWGLAPIAATDENDDVDIAREEQIGLIRNRYVEVALPALQMWATDLAGKMAEASTAELKQLMDEGAAVARGLTTLGDSDTVKKMHNAAKAAKKRLEVKK